MNIQNYLKYYFLGKKGSIVRQPDIYRYDKNVKGISLPFLDTIRGLCSCSKGIFRYSREQSYNG